MPEAFLPKVVISQSLDGKTLTIIDQSNFATNTDGVAVEDISQFGVIVYDKNDQQIQALNLDYPTGTIQVAKDLFLRFNLNYVDGDTTYTNDVTFLSTQFYDILARKVSSKQGCDCGCKDQLCGPACKALQCKNAAISSLIAGDYVNAQDGIDKANIFIIQALKSC